MHVQYGSSMKVSILGKLYSIKSSHDPEFMQEAAALLAEKINQLQKKMGPMPAEKIAVLVGLNLAGELIELKKSHKDSAKKIKKRVEYVFEKLDALEKNQNQ
ncbi:cell division protein ZapA [bacterium]|nr:cell division protein ZapA [bacterium]